MLPRSDRPRSSQAPPQASPALSEALHPSCKPRPHLPHCGGAAVRTPATVGHSFCVEPPCCVGWPWTTGADLRRGDDRPCLLRRSADRPTNCRRFGADRIQVREWLLGCGGHRRTASAPATARAENGTCQRTRIVDDTCPTPRDPISPGSRAGRGDTKGRDIWFLMLPNRRGSASRHGRKRGGCGDWRSVRRRTHRRRTGHWHRCARGRPEPIGKDRGPGKRAEGRFGQGNGPW